MSARRNKSPESAEDLFDFFVAVPIWIGPIFAFLAFAGMRWAVPSIISSIDPKAAVAVAVLGTVQVLSIALAPYASAFVLFAWICAELWKRKNRNRLDRQTDIDSIQALPWQEFELLLSEAFRRQGYFVEHVGKAGPDGGIDQRLERGGKTTLVQCKHWHSYQVGVKIVRELYGVVASEHADAGIVVTSGTFTPDAIEFARKVPMTLIDGDELVRMIGEVQKSTVNKPAPERVVSAPPVCPKCASRMVLRINQRGSNPGSQFWGCSRFPACRGTRELSVSEA